MTTTPADTSHPGATAIGASDPVRSEFVDRSLKAECVSWLPFGQYPDSLKR
jgi:hypothetical protein